MVAILFLLAPGGFKAFSDARSPSKSAIVGAAIVAKSLCYCTHSVLKCSMECALLRIVLGILQPTRMREE